MEKKFLRFSLASVIILLLFFFMSSCSASKDNYDVRYEKVWKELIKSQAWKDALKNDQRSVTSESNDFYASTEDVGLAEERQRQKTIPKDLFVPKYDMLVARAYAKIIAEAEVADSRLEGEYLSWNAKGKRPDVQKDKSFRQKLAAVNNRYQAHRKMLEGLKAWNIFSEFGTDDLEFFKAEHSDEVRQMLHNGHGEGNVIGFLVYKLADLYHFEG